MLELLIGLVILIAIVALGFMLFTRLRGSAEGRRAERVFRLEKRPSKEGPRREPTVDTLLPGDAIAFSDGNNAVVESVLECAESVGTRHSTWRWSFLDGQMMLEASREGNVLFQPPTILLQGSAPFQALVAESDDGGVLKTFELRVREGTSASQPATFEHAGQTFHIRSTGTFTARAIGKPLGDVWDDVSPQAGDNVYFEAESLDGENLLGVWTTHIAVLVGRSLGRTDIDAMYPGAEAQS